VRSSRTQAQIVPALLETYAAGRHTEAVSQLTNTSDAREVFRQYRKLADRWVASAEAVDRKHRQAVVLALFLEAGRVAIENPRAYSEWKKDLEHYCDVVADFPEPFARLWLLGSIALLHGSRDAVLLAGAQTEPLAYRSTGHASHAARRFPDEPRFALAPVIVRRELNLVTNRPGTPVRFLVFQLTRIGEAGFVDVSPDKLAATIADLTRLSDDQRIGPEARLRLGILLFHLNRLDESTRQLQLAARSDDPFVTFLAELSRGLLAQSAGRARTAETSLRTAVEMLPTAQSGLIALAAHLFRAGARDEAAALMERLNTTTEAPDPWREYSFGDLRFWRKYQEQLREMLPAMKRS
jgi:tetratricopeptide (TPR) repeat protein